MNMPVVQTGAPQLPAHLQRHMIQQGGVNAVAADVMSGLSSGAIHKISIEGRRWKLQDPQGQEFMVPQFHLDVILVGANPHVSKTFYATKWNQQQEGKAPDCWSDNGVGPSSRAAAPQCGTCQLCPNNAWGSRISETGSQVKACADSKKIAVILADNPTGPVYQLKVPADSLKNMANMAKAVASRGAPLDRVIMRLEFDPAVSHPKIVFSSPDYVNVAQDAAVDEVLGSDEISEALNLSDIAIKAMPQIAQQPMPQAPVQVPQMQPVAVPQMPPQMAAPQAPQYAPQPVPQMPAAPQYAAPAAPVAPAYNPMQPAAPVAPVAVAPQPVAPAAEAPAPAKRRRKAAALPEGATPVAAQPQYAAPQAPTVQQVYQAPPGMPASAAPHPVVPQLVAAPQLPPDPAATQVMPPMPQFLQRVPDVPGAMAPAASVPLVAQPTDGALDNILGDAMVR